MPLPDLDSAVGASFGLEVDGIVIDRIDDVTGLTVEQDVIELKENTPDGRSSSGGCPVAARPGTSR